MKSLLILTLCALTTSALAQDIAIKPGSEEWKEMFYPAVTKPTEVATGSTLRKQLFDLLRPAMEKEAGKGPMRFQGSLKTYMNWAFFLGTVLDAKDKAINFPPADNSDSAALWLRTRSGWQLVDHAVGFGDTFYWQWHQQYGAPRALLGLD